jgi:hypothetical protein
MGKEWVRGWLRKRRRIGSVKEGRQVEKKEEEK